VRTLLRLNLRKKSHCQTAHDALDSHLGHVRTRLKKLRNLENDLAALRDQCDGQGDQCQLIEALHNKACMAGGEPIKTKQHQHV
jgi:hypothetical protein